MKYIRTKYGNIFEKKKELGGYVFYENGTYTSYYYNEQNGLSLDDFFKERGGVIKQADNLEELFDELVAITEDESHYLFSIYEIDNKKYVYINEESGEPLLETFIKNKNIYGAIWTDKGLIYVAKMKGILPNGEIDWELL